MEVKLKEDTPLMVEKTVDDKIELIKGVSEVRSKIKDVVSDDFILCKLTPQEKEYIIELTNNAFLSRKLLKTVKEQGTKWDWDKKKNLWERRKLNQEEKLHMENLIQNCFDSYMNRIYMITIVNRNVPRNYIVEKITGIRDEEEEEETRLQSLTDKVKKKLGIQKEDE